MTYKLLDSGDFEKLELVGGFRVSRPAAQAVWKKSLGPAEWKNIDAHYERISEGKGEWRKSKQFPAQWPIELSDLKLQMRLTSFGHLGLFAEQATNWHELENICKDLRQSLSRPPVILNLFAYTGAASLACAKAGAEVVHVDASKGTVDWARQNFEINGLGAHPVRFLVDDVAAFVKREVRRARSYDGIILDPPTYGRGPDKQLWKIEEHLLPLMADLFKLKNDQKAFILLSCHSPGYTPISLRNLLAQAFGKKYDDVESSEMVIVDQAQKALPSGVSAILKF